MLNFPDLPFLYYFIPIVAFSIHRYLGKLEFVSICDRQNLRVPDRLSIGRITQLIRLSQKTLAKKPGF